jgi:hypothetical protein
MVVLFRQLARLSDGPLFEPPPAHPLRQSWSKPFAIDIWLRPRPHHTLGHRPAQLEAFKTKRSRPLRSTVRQLEDIEASLV